MNMGVAYTDVPRGAGIAYFPAVSLSYCESCHLNFGATPFLYPLVSTYIQDCSGCMVVSEPVYLNIEYLNKISFTLEPRSFTLSVNIFPDLVYTYFHKHFFIAKNLF